MDLRKGLANYEKTLNSIQDVNDSSRSEWVLQKVINRVQWMGYLNLMS